MIAIDAGWRAANPLPSIGDGLDKNARGRVVMIGGSALVPGALLLTGQAALRAGAGKIQLATIESAAIALGVAFPEAAIVALPEDDDGELALAAFERIEAHLDGCDTLLIGPGMTRRPQTAALVTALLDGIGSDAPVLLDAGALTAMADREAFLRARSGGVVMTPHPGELAALTGTAKDAIERDPAQAAAAAAERFGCIVALKTSETFIADQDGTMLHYCGGSPGLGTAGSGDVLAGIIAGLLARGTAPMVATGWGVWLHGQAGALATERIGPLGFLARELAAFVPQLMKN